MKYSDRLLTGQSAKVNSFMFNVFIATDADLGINIT